MASASNESVESFRQTYRRNGYAVVRGLFAAAEIAEILPVIVRFHTAWCSANPQFYASKAINSAYLTDSHHLCAEDRRALFRVLSAARLAPLIDALIPHHAAFLNTQLFFNPVNPEQANYWHRDIQYTEQTLAEQQAQFKQINVLHFRLALRPERGLELIPGTHLRWDTEQEFAVRMAQPGFHVNDDLPNSDRVALAPGDLLVFSANMIHRGLYGGDRLAFDMLFCDPLASILQFARPSCLPSDEDLQQMQNTAPFLATRRVLAMSKG